MTTEAYRIVRNASNATVWRGGELLARFPTAKQARAFVRAKRYGERIELCRMPFSDGAVRWRYLVFKARNVQGANAWDVTG